MNKPTPQEYALKEAQFEIDRLTAEVSILRRDFRERGEIIQRLNAVYDTVKEAMKDELEQGHDLHDLTPWWADVEEALAAVAALHTPASGSPTPKLGCDYQGQEFGAHNYPDSVCVEGYLWDADSGEATDDGWMYDSGGDIPCPKCNREEYDEYHADDADDAADSSPTPAVCEWFEDDDGWHGSCGKDWEFIDDGPKENGVNFCMDCGRPVEIETADSKQKRCEPCRATGLIHCAHPDECGGPWDTRADQRPTEGE